MHYLNLLGFLRVPFMLDGKIEPPFGPGAKFHSEPLSPFDNQQGQ
jgi:hypothetical protein